MFISTEKHLNALSDNRQSSTKMTYTPEGTTTAIMNSTSESSNASSDSESPSSDTVITTESSGSIQITSRVRKQGSKKRLSGINGEFSLGKLIDNKIERELSQEGSSCAGSSECGSQGTNEDVSEDDTKKDGDEPSAAESLVSIFMIVKILSGRKIVCEDFVILPACLYTSCYLTSCKMLCFIFASKINHFNN